MSKPVQIPVAEIRQCLDEESLREWVRQQRWYASKSRAVTGIEIVEGVALQEDPQLFLALVQTRFATGTHELYRDLLLPGGVPNSIPGLGVLGLIDHQRRIRLKQKQEQHGSGLLAGG